jgi:hypothetical protein
MRLLNAAQVNLTGNHTAIGMLPAIREVTIAFTVFAITPRKRALKGRLKLSGISPWLAGFIKKITVSNIHSGVIPFAAATMLIQ